MTLCPYSLVLPLDGVLILRPPLMSLLSSIICFSRFLVIPFGLSLIYTLSSLVEVHRSSAKSHGLFFPVFIHRILLHLGLEGFPTSELVHIINPIGVTFLQ